MSRIIVMNHVTLDGVMQGPGRADEDIAGGFTHGGWALDDPAAGEVWGQRMAAGGGLAGWLFGRRTYEDVLGYWTQRADSPFGAALTQAPKYVASRTLSEPAPWPNTKVLGGTDLAAAVAHLKAETEGVLAVMGSGQVINALMPHDLIDEFLLMINPCVLGSGHRLFTEGTAFTRLRCDDVTLTPAGLVIATYSWLSHGAIEE